MSTGDWVSLWLVASLVVGAVLAWAITLCWLAVRFVETCRWESFWNRQNRRSFRP